MLLVVLGAAITSSRLPRRTSVGLGSQMRCWELVQGTWAIFPSDQQHDIQ